MNLAAEMLPVSVLDRVYVWQDESLLQTALRHTSWCNEHRGCEPNERLEWLGDSVLDLLVADALFHAYPKQREGYLSEQRSERVKTQSLARAAQRLGLDAMLQLGKGSQQLREQPSVLADTMEAVIGAAYLDGGLPAARTVAMGAGIFR
jgi:ribonuclease-3